MNNRLPRSPRNGRGVSAFRLYVPSSAALRLGLLLLLLCCLNAAEARGQACPLLGSSGGESLEAHITVDGTGEPVADGAVLPVGTRLRIDARATAFGSCGNAACGIAYNRTVSTIFVWSTITTNTNLNGNYTTGYVYGKKPDGTTADWNVLDTTASNSTGPVYDREFSPGTYQYHIETRINTTPCELGPDRTGPITITVYLRDPDNPNDLGPTDCKGNVGQPVNVSSGNMYMTHTDYSLPGEGGGLRVERTYNSQSKRSGLFGYGWTSDYDEGLGVYGAMLVRLNLPSGRSVYFGRKTAAEPFLPLQAPDFRGQIVKNADGSYTYSLPDGSAHQFNAAGKLIMLADRNNNQTLLAYDANGKLSTVTDPYGRALTFTHGSYGVATISDSTGVVATYSYNWLKWLLSVTYADNSRLDFTYGYFNDYPIINVKDALGNILEAHTYDSSGRALTSERQGGVERYTLAYVSATETDVTDALGHVTKYFFDRSKGRSVVTRVEGGCDCGGSTSVDTWTYDASLNVTSRTDALGHATSYTYDAAGNRLTETDARGTTTYTYNALGQVLTVVDPLNGETHNEYDAHGNLLSTTDARGGVTSYAYDGRGRVLTVTDPRGNIVSRLTYDAAGNVAHAGDAFDNGPTFAYDARGRLTSTTGAAGGVTTYTYDAANRTKTVTRPDASVVTYTYDLAGRRTKVTDGRGNSTNYTYDTAYRLTKVTDAALKETTYAYDLMSKVTGVTDPLGRTTNYTYDAADRLTKVTYPEASAGAGRTEESYAYDAGGNLVQKTDAAGRVTAFCYDAASRLSKVTDAALKDTLYEYDARSRLTATVDALGQRYEFTYDAGGNVTQAKRAGLTASFVYDASGNRTRRTDYNGAITNYAYDAANRLTGVSYPNGTGIVYGYDAASRVTSAANQNGTVALAYDSRGRVGSTTDVWGQAVSYAYDANGNRTGMTLAAVSSTAYQYDALNRLTQITDGAGGVFASSYDAAGRLTTRSAPNGVAAAYTYDGLNRLTRLKHTKGAATVADYQYRFNAAGDVAQSTDGAGAHAFSYDAVSRLTSAAHPAGQPSETYTYDAAGNRTASHLSSTYSYQPFNRVVAVGSDAYAYDANGNLTSKTDAAGAWQYFWDYENRLVSVWRPDGLVVNYKYDALGRRVETSRSAGGWTRYSYDRAEVALDRSSDGGTVEYTNGPGPDEKLSQRAGGLNPLYFVRDHLDSTRALTDGGGNVVEADSYDSFGGAAGSALTRYGYAGRERDADTGLYLYRARWYDPQVGRFISEDPAGLEGGVNLYAYVSNSPLRYRDPNGRTGQDSTQPRPSNMPPYNGWDRGNPPEDTDRRPTFPMMIPRSERQKELDRQLDECRCAAGRDQAKDLGHPNQDGMYPDYYPDARDWLGIGVSAGVGGGVAAGAATYGASAAGFATAAAVDVGVAAFWPAAAVGLVTSAAAVPISRWSWNDSYRRGWDEGVRRVYQERMDQCLRKYMWESGR